MRVGLITMNKPLLEPSLLWNHNLIVLDPSCIATNDYYIIYELAPDHIKRIWALCPNTSTHHPKSHLYNYIIIFRN
jgi:hypothetical protein